MPCRPFLSHKREDADAIVVLRRELTMRGAGGWQDVHDLGLGARVRAAIHRAIGRETGGFIWYGTRAALESQVICKIEVPAALRRARRRGDAVYPVVPLFVDISPGADRPAIRRALRGLLARRRGDELLDLNGLVKDEAESVEGFCRRAARLYIRDLVRAHPGEQLSVAITGGREPTTEHDLVLDWRELLVDGRVEDATALTVIKETLSDVREAAQSRGRIPKIEVDPTLRLPLAALVGWAWNRVRPVELTVVQTSVSASFVVKDYGAVDTAALPAAVRTALPGDGPALVAVSVGKDIGDAAAAHAEARGASELIQLHVPVDRTNGGVLGPAEIARVASWTIDELAALRARGEDKELLLLGPVSLATRIGAAANGTGRTLVPFWDGDTGYTGGVRIG
jgi:hypothetical protein